MTTKIKGDTKIKAGEVGELPQDVIARISASLVDKFPEKSPAEYLSDLPKRERDEWLASLTPEEHKALEHDWNFWARPKQRIPKGNWSTLIACAGRGFGKTRFGAEWVRHTIENWDRALSGPCHLALVAENAKDLRRVIVEDVRGGGSGLLQVCPPWNMPDYSPTKMRLTWNNPNYKSYGSSCSLYSAEEPNALRGPAHHGAWLDELCKWPRVQECWDMLQFGLRMGNNPQVVITTTPKPIPLFLELYESYLRDPVAIRFITGSTFENSLNLSEKFLSEILDKYEGTRLGSQELYAEILGDVEGALWNRSLVDRAVKEYYAPAYYRQTVVGVDPQMSSVQSDSQKKTAKGFMTGIVVASSVSPRHGRPMHGIVRADRSMSGSPKEWAEAVIAAYDAFGAAYVIAERNQGGELITSNIHNVDSSVRVKLVTATKSKGERAIPVVSRYEQNRVFHAGNFSDLVSEMLTFTPGDEKKKRSPNRLDALVHALDYLLVSSQKSGAGVSIKRRI